MESTRNYIATKWGLVLDCLRNAKRYLATASFTADTGLKEGMELVREYNLLMKDFPLDNLLSATDLPKIQERSQVCLCI